MALAFLDREDLAGADASTDAITDDAAVAAAVVVFAAVSAVSAVVEAFFFAFCAFEWSICAKRAAMRPKRSAQPEGGVNSANRACHRDVARSCEGTDPAASHVPKFDKSATSGS